MIKPFLRADEFSKRDPQSAPEDVGDDRAGNDRRPGPIRLNFEPEGANPGKQSEIGMRGQNGHFETGIKGCDVWATHVVPVSR
jgi:hypothetical protein